MSGSFKFSQKTISSVSGVKSSKATSKGRKTTAQSFIVETKREDM